jgi:dTMP kinase
MVFVDNLIPQNGMFITLEGSEGSGKTSQLPVLADYLRQQSFPVVTTREPGGTPIGDQIRAVILSLENTAMQPRTEILLLQASRAQLVEQLVRPRLAAGEVVLCDRYADSSLAYQGYGYERDLAPLRAISRYATGALVPDVTLLLDVPVETGLQRKLGGVGDAWNRMEQKLLDYHRRVRAGYLAMAAEESERWIVVDASLGSEQVQDAIRVAVVSCLARSLQAKGGMG